MIMRINPFVGISRMRKFRMVDMCKGKRKLWLRGTDDVLVVRLHMVGKRVKVSSLSNVTSFIALYFFLFFYLIHPSHIFIASPLFFFFFFSFSYIFFSFFTFLLYIFSFFLYFFLSFPYSYFSIYFSLSWHLFKALNSSLSCTDTIWNLK
jgi:hypothetical protein